MPATTWRPDGGMGMSKGDSVVNHVVIPRAPFGNGRSCLNGTGKEEYKNEDGGTGAMSGATGGWSGA